MPQTNTQSLVRDHVIKGQRQPWSLDWDLKRHNKMKFALESPYVNTLPRGTWIYLDEGNIPDSGFQIYNENKIKSEAPNVNTFL